MSPGNALVRYLREQVPERRVLADLLGGDDRVCCYYLCPFSNLRQIVEEGIRCRNSGVAAVDLSSPDIQWRRKTVSLARSEGEAVRSLSGVPVHSCVNCFWNPLNGTFWAFQRKALLCAAESGESEDGIVCILELDAELLLGNGLVSWVALSKNAASSPVASSSPSQLADRSYFPWARIYAVGDSTSKQPWQARAAELLVYLPGAAEDYTRPVPPAFLRRVILSPQILLSTSQEGWFTRCRLRCSRANVFSSAVDLLRPEYYFLKNLCGYQAVDPECVQRICAAFRLLLDCEREFGGLTADHFDSARMAHGWHGIGHVTRVMFWAAFLATHPHGLARTDGHNAAILAAFLHDLCRRGNSEDTGHGGRVLGKYRDLIGRVLREPKIQDSCRNAVRMHSRLDVHCLPGNRDYTWQILKDADGLERGRFARPGQGGQGCDPDLLRLRWLGKAFDDKSHVPWLAYQLARMTRYTGWGERPCLRLLKDFCLSLDAGIEQRVFSGRCAAIAEQLLSRLQALRERQTQTAVGRVVGVASGAAPSGGQAAVFDDRGKRKEEGCGEPEPAPPPHERSDDDLNGSPQTGPAAGVPGGTGATTGTGWRWWTGRVWTSLGRFCSWLLYWKSGARDER
jgi:hypothetical protein